MWSVLVVLLIATPVFSAARMDHYPPGYYFGTHPNVTQSEGLFYVEGHAAYQTFSKARILLSNLKPELEALYEGCGAVTIQPETYLTHGRYQRFVAAQVGPRPGSKLMLYVSPGSDVHYCALEDPDSFSLSCLTSAQQRLVKCLQKKLPPPNQQLWDKLVSVILWGTVLLMKLLF